MRIYKGIIVVLLILSLVGNAICYFKFVKGRSALQVNGESITTKELNNFLAMRHGVDAMAAMVQQDLVTQACEKAGIKIPQAEIDELIADQKERSPAVALQLKREPFREEDLRNQLKTRLAMDLLRAKDVTATDDEIKDYFNSTRSTGVWDKPDKFEIQAVRCTDANVAMRAEQLLKSGVSDMTIVQQQLDPRGATAQAIGMEGKVVVTKPVGKPSTDPLVNKVAAMKDGEVGRIDAPRAILVLRRVKMTPGKVSELADVRPKVERAFKLTRALPAREVLRKLWDAAKIDTENPDTKKQIQWLIFREPVAEK